MAPDKDYIDIYDLIDESSPVTIWCLSLRRLTFWESWVVGWRLWLDGIAKYPWKVKR